MVTLRQPTSMVNAVKTGAQRLTDRTALVPVYHTEYWGWLTRNKQNPEQQKEDWKRVEAAILQSRRGVEGDSPSPRAETKSQRLARERTRGIHLHHQRSRQGPSPSGPLGSDKS
jgi:hypothetical protein